MKTTRFFFTVLGFGALTLGVGVAAEPPNKPSPRVMRENHTPTSRPGGPVQASRELMERNFLKSSQAAPIKPQSKRQPIKPLAPPMLQKAAGAANGGSIVNKMENRREQPGKLPGLRGTAEPSPGLSRSRSASPAVLGGLTGSNGKNSIAALNGATMRRKP
jgi:hypothetical protein